MYSPHSLLTPLCSSFSSIKYLSLLLVNYAPSCPASTISFVVLSELDSHFWSVADSQWTGSCSVAWVSHHRRCWLSQDHRQSMALYPLNFCSMKSKWCSSSFQQPSRFQCLSQSLPPAAAHSPHFAPQWRDSLSCFLTCWGNFLIASWSLCSECLHSHSWAGAAAAAVTLGPHRRSHSTSHRHPAKIQGLIFVSWLARGQRTSWRSCWWSWYHQGCSSWNVLDCYYPSSYLMTTLSPL